MTWDRMLRVAAWGLFCLIWIPIGYLVWYDGTGSTSEEFDTTLILLFVGMMILCFVLLFLGYFGPLFLGMWQGRRIRAGGTPATATILSVSDTGMYVNEQPVFRIVLSVRPPYEPVFETTIQEIVPFSAIPQVQPGAQLQVYYLPGTTSVALAD